MKTLSKKIGLLCALLFALCMVVGCGGSKVKLSFDTDGGPAVETVTVSGGAEVELPEPSGNKEADGEEYAFDGWISPNGEVVRGTITAPKEDTTYRAKWTKIEKTVGYAIEIYVSALDGTGYAQDTALTVTGSGKVGETPQIPQLKGLLFNAEHGSNVMPGALSKEESENEFRLYYDREEYYYDYDAGLSAGVAVTGEMTGGAALFGAKITLQQNGYAASGYRFLGWSSAPNGGVEYLPGAEVEIESNAIFYAVWEKGYSNRLGGNDYIYFPEDEEGVAILERGGAEFYGTRDGNDFLFKQTGLKGRVSGNTFVYYNTDLAREYVYVGFNVANDPNLSDEEKLNEEITLEIDAYLMATYRERENGAVVKEVKGALTFDSLYGDYLLDAGSESMHLTLGTFTNSAGDEVEAFSVRGEEGDATDYYYQAIPHGEGAVIGSYAVTFDGYGTFILVDTNYMDTYMGIYYVLGRQVDSEGAIYYEMVGLVSDDWGNMKGIPGNIVKLEFITMQYGEGIDAAYYFIQRDSSAGRYEGADGSVLTLDGFGRLSESAVYEKEGKRYTGSYRYTYSEVFGSKIEATLYSTEGGSEGRGYVFTLSGKSFTVETALQDEEKLGEYLQFTYDAGADDGRGSPAFQTPFTSLVIYDTDYTEGGVTGKCAELWIKLGESAERVARGYITVESLGTGADFMPFACSTFTATEASGEYENLTFKFLTNLTTPDGVNYYDVFYILEYNGEARYEVHEEVDAEGKPTGGKLWHMMLNEGMGSLYFTADGFIYEGSYSYTASDYFDGYEGMFVWIDYANSEYRGIYFMMDENGAGYTIRHIEEDERERPVYEMINGELEPMVNFTIRGPEEVGGEAIYNSDGLDAGSPTKGAFSPSGKQTVFGEEIYKFTFSGRALWYFVMEDYYYAPQDMWIKVYYKASSPDISETYAVEGGGTLTVDGFHRARLETPEGEVYGEYYIDQYGSSLGFISEEGTGKSYSLEAGVLSPLDGAYGTWNLYDGVRHFYGEIDFDGRGGCILRYELREGNTYNIQGTYRPMESEEEMSCILTIDIGDGEKDYYAQFRIITLMEIELREVTVRDDDTYGIFRGDDMSVLALDGLGYGTFYDANGNAGDYGYLEMLSEEDNFACFSSYSNYDVTYFLLLDPENKSYRLLDYTEYGQVYYAEDLQGVEFGLDGNASFPFGFGPYFVEEAVAHVFVRDNMTGNYVGHEVPAPTDGEYRYDEKTYYRWEKETETVTFHGQITFENEEAIEATLTVTLDGNPWLDTAAILSAQNENYSNLSFVYLNIGAQGLRSGAYLRDPNMNYFPLSVHYDPSGKSTFEAEGGSQRTVLQDGYEADAQINGELDHPISTLTTTYKGFGPIVLGDQTIEGKLYYQPLMTDGKPFTFTAEAKNVTLIGEDYSEGKLYLLPFEIGGEKYAMSYYSNSGRFELYMMMKYTKVEAGDYEVGVGRFLYSNRFNFPGIAEGDFCAAVVYQEGKAIVAYNQFCYPGQNAAWVIDLGTYDQFEGKGALGKAYWIDVTFDDNKDATSAQVREYSLKQALSADGMYLVNFFLNEEGEIEKLAALAVSEGGYVFVRFDSAEGSEDCYEVKYGDTVYTVKIEHDDQGERQSGDLNEQGALVPAENGSGEYWIITVTFER